MEQYDLIKDKYAYFQERTFEQVVKYLRAHRPQLAVNCWMCKEQESDLMWNLYGNKGVAIKSSVKRLIEAVNVDRASEHKAWLADVEYINYKKDGLKPEKDDFEKVWLAFHKRNCFEDEREIRLIIKKPLEDSKSNPFPESGIKLKVDLNKLLRAVTIYPGSEKSVLPVIKRELKHHKLNEVKVSKSRTLMGEPLF